MIKKLNKHVIVTGIPRAGKTTLSMELSKYGYIHYRMDAIKRSICEIFSLDGHNWNDMSRIMSRMIKTMIEENKTDIVDLNEYYVIDTCHLLPKDIKLIPKDTIVVYLGYADISLEDKLKEIEKYDKDNYWTKTIDKESLRRMIKANIEYSKVIKEECLKYKIKYFDTSYNRDIVIKEIIDYIINSN